MKRRDVIFAAGLESVITIPRTTWAANVQKLCEKHHLDRSTFANVSMADDGQVKIVTSYGTIIASTDLSEARRSRGTPASGTVGGNGAGHRLPASGY